MYYVLFLSYVTLSTYICLSLSWEGLYIDGVGGLSFLVSEPATSVFTKQPPITVEHLHSTHSLPRDASAECGNATVSRPYVCLSVCLSVRDV